MADRIEILGIGNPLIDYYCPVDDAFLTSHGLTPGMPHHFEYDRVADLLTDLTTYAEEHGLEIVKEVGGCAFNTVRTSAALGMSCAFAGGIGINSGYTAEAASYNIELLVSEAGRDNGICIYLVNPESKTETIVVSVGAAASGLEQLKDSLLPANVLLIESFVLAWDSVFEVLKNYTHYNILYLDLGSPRSVQMHSARIVHLLQNSKGIITGTEAEFAAFEGILQDRNIKLDDIIDTYDLVFKNGKLGAKMVTKDRDFAYMKPSNSRVVCTAGAGDNFAAAFLYARHCNLPPVGCIEAGNKAGSLCVEKPLAVLADKDIKKIKEVCNDFVIK